jgi:sporulation protein YlmC with PRC-barrel domain
LFDGNLDSIIVTDFKLIPGGTNIHSPYKAVNVSFTQNPVNVSIYSIDGRLVGKIDNVKIEALDNMLSSLNLFRSKVMLAEWSQNGVKCSKRIMNLTKNNK